MHIMEGFLPVEHAVAWSVVSAPFVVAGVRRVKRQLTENPESRLTLGAVGAFAFVLSALKLPSVAGSSSHPTGVGLGAIAFGPQAMTVVGTLVLVFQALLLAHGGITTLGANVFSMAIVGPWLAWGTWMLARRMGLGMAPAVFAGAFAANMGTYLMTSAQLALAFPEAEGGVTAAFAKFAGIFAVTQIPLAVAEALLTVVVIGALASRGLLNFRVEAKA